MQKCKKCSSVRTSGPTYNSATDTLDYRCKECGYSWKRLPDDHSGSPADDLGRHRDHVDMIKPEGSSGEMGSRAEVLREYFRRFPDVFRGKVPQPAGTTRARSRVSPSRESAAPGQLYYSKHGFILAKARQ